MANFDSLVLATISIHAPAKGATFSSGALYASLINFNPRSREGSDQEALY